MTQIHGHADAGFGRVADTFADNFETGGELGAAFCLYVDGVKRVDLWAGVADSATGRAWDESTLQFLLSTTKGVVATAIAIAVEAGSLGYDDRVTDHWPEFAAGGKDDVTVAQLLSHQAGLIALEAPIDFDQIMAVTPAIESLQQQAPIWPLGEGHGYHALTFGWLAGELLARADGRRIGRFVQDEIVGPLGLDLWIGLPEPEEPRVSALEPPLRTDDPEQLARLARVYGPDALGFRALTLDGRIRMAPVNHFNTRAMHATEMPAVNGIADARSIARMYAATIGEVDGVRLLDHETMQAARTERVDGPDRIFLVPTRFGAGYWLHNDTQPMIQDGSFGHPGAGGSLGFANPELGIGFGYVMNQMGSRIVGDARHIALADAALTCVT